MASTLCSAALPSPLLAELLVGSMLTESFTVGCVPHPTSVANINTAMQNAAHFFVCFIVISLRFLSAKLFCVCLPLLRGFCIKYIRIFMHCQCIL
jgi:hypothetical protein